MQTTTQRRIPRARRLDPPASRDRSATEPAPRPARRPAPHRASRGPQGPVEWWARPSPDDDEERWAALQRIQGSRLRRDIPVTEVARRLEEIGAPLTRETISRVLNGKQPTTWETVSHLAEVLGVPVETPRR